MVKTQRSISQQSAAQDSEYTEWTKKVIPLVQFQNTQTLTVNKLNIQR